ATRQGSANRTCGMIDDLLPNERSQEGGHHARLAEPVAGEMVLQVPCGIHTEVSPQGDLRGAQARYWTGTARTMRSGGRRDCGRSCNGGSHPPVFEHSTEILRGAYGWFSQRQISDPNPSALSGQATAIHGLPLLGSRL